MSRPTSRPSVAELRAVSQPAEILGRSAHEHWAGRLYVRRLSIHLTRVLVPTRVTPDTVTALMAVAGVGAAVVLTVPTLWAAVVTFGLLQLQLLLDCADGELARWRRATGSVRGIYLDGLAHNVTDALVIAALGVHADGGFHSLAGWCTVGLVAAVLGQLVHAETDQVYVARAKAGLPLPAADGVAPTVGALRRLRRALTRLPVNRLLSAWDLGFVVVITAVVDRATGGLAASRVLVVALVGVGAYAVAGHLLSVLTSRRLR